MEPKYDLDLFVNLSKYKPSENVTPLENFTTELFVYILKDLLRKKSNTGYKICKLFGINNPDEIEFISTQKEYSVDNKKLRPDITIELAKRTIFIEVKVDSPLHPSILKRNLNDQLEDYQQIEIPEQKVIVYSLTKYSVCSSVQKNVRWRDISNILDKKEEKNQILDNFQNFLKINNMGVGKPMTKETANIIETYNSFFSFLEEIFNNSKFKENKKYQLSKRIINEEDFGFYIMDASKPKSTNEDNSFYWFGIVSTYTDYLSFEVIVHCLMNDYSRKTNWSNKWKKDSWGINPIISTIKLSRILNHEDYDGQIEEGTEWLNKIYDELENIVKKKYI